jgi:citrate lyase subunit beta/citryl-CoA lyase
MLPKVESPSQLSNLHGMLTVLETQIGVKPGKTILFSLVETALGIEKTFDIFSAEIIPTRKIIVALGSADLCLDLGIDMTRNGNELWYPRSRLALGCRAAGIDPPIDSPYLKNIKDKDLIMRDAQNAKKVGFQGKLCIHPIQIDIVNEVFTPSAEDLIFARKVIDAFKNAVEQGNGAIEVDGKMIDQPLVERCRRIVKLCC